jgi:hypothetical protein
VSRTSHQPSVVQHICIHKKDGPSTAQNLPRAPKGDDATVAKGWIVNQQDTGWTLEPGHLVANVFCLMPDCDGNVVHVEFLENRYMARQQSFAAKR